MKDVTYDFLYNQELDHWWYRGRRQLVHFLFSKYVSSGGNLRILDVGCGAGVLMGEMSQYGNVHGIDVSPLSVEYCKKRGFQNVKVDDLTHLSFPDRSFDVVIALDVLEHIEDDASALREIYRVLADDGVAIIFVPAFMTLWGEADEMGKHFRRYRREGLLSRTKLEHFEVIHSSYFNTLLFPPIYFIRLVSRTLKLVRNIEFSEPHPLINLILKHVFSLEIRMLSFVSFPFGVSFFTVIQKQYENNV